MKRPTEKPDWESVVTACLLVVVLAVIGGTVYHGCKEDRECEAMGGVRVRAGYGMRCIDAEELP